MQRVSVQTALAAHGDQTLAIEVEGSGFWRNVRGRAGHADHLRNVQEEEQGNRLDCLRQVHDQSPRTTVPACCRVPELQDTTGEIGIRSRRRIVNACFRMLPFCACRHALVSIAHSPKGLVCNSLVTTEAAYRALKQPQRYGNRSHQPSFPALARREGAAWPAFLPATARLASAGRALFRERSAWASS